MLVVSRKFGNVSRIYRRNIHHSVAIVGSGPSGFYSAKYCLEQNENIRVDMFEKLPTPYGLVRFGVAPDHPEVKSVMETFQQVASSNRFRYFGNIEISDKKRSGTMKLDNLLESYSAVILAYGAASDMNLNIPGEDLTGVLSARDFVNWYNGHPDHKDIFHDSFNLRHVKHVVIVGNGNVALDCARILAKDFSDLATTDISSLALEDIMESRVETITVVGRRGHIQAAFTIKELRELTKIPNVDISLNEDDYEKGLNEESLKEIENNRPKKRITDLMKSILEKKSNPTKKREIVLRFLLQPKEALAESRNKISKISFYPTILKGAALNQKPIVDENQDIITLPCDLLLKSVGYKCEPISKTLPFNNITNTVANKQGRVHVEDTDNCVPGLYVTGWLKRGATGIIGSNIPDAKETVQMLIEDINNDKLTKNPGFVNDERFSLFSHKLHDGKPNFNIQVKTEFKDSAAECFRVSEVDFSNVVTWGDYLSIECEEERRGRQSDPPRIRGKFLDVAEMLLAAGVSGNH